jgi:putative acetyltransferase
MELICTNGNDKRFIDLCCELDAYLNEVTGGEYRRSEYVQYNTLEDIHDVILVIDEEKAVGCGSFKKYNENIAEIKRVFIINDYRGCGISKLIMKALEEKAIEKGYSQLILETGRILEAATNLYLNLGYEITENYGQYIDMSESLCMSKDL